MCPLKVKPPNSQSGAVLLALMLVIITGASYMLVSGLNANTRLYNRQIETSHALSEARAALIAYALMYPENVNPNEGPGYLPCPDRTDPVTGNPNDIGRSGTACSFGGGTIIGRFPWKSLRTSDLRDHTGERLWYAVSENFKNNPKVMGYLNSETPGTFSVDAINDIVAIVFAPGTPVANQNRNLSESITLLDPANYLEGGNEIVNNSYVSRAAGEFNDQLVYITRKDLMQAVEQRVINQARTVMNEYFEAYDERYPWMAAFADPKAGGRWLKSRASAAGNTLVDNRVDFIKWGVSTGDIVWNITDGSHGIVNNVYANSLTLDGNGLGFGLNNTFANGNEYYVQIRDLPARFSGTATAGSAGLILRDNSRDFDELRVSAGDIVDNITDGSSGMVISALNNQITVATLAGGSRPINPNTFQSGDTYRIRSNLGISESTGTELEDSGANFVRMNVQAGDLVHNLTRGTTGVALGVVSPGQPHRLQLAEMEIASGDHYMIERFNGRPETPQGLLPVYEPGSPVPVELSGLTIDWSFLVADGNTVTQPVSGNHTVYNAGLSNWTQSSSGRASTIILTGSDASCNWVSLNTVNCQGIYTDQEFLTGEVTNSTGAFLTDTDKNFPEAGVKRGDKVENTTDNTWGIVSGTATGTNSNRLTIANIFGSTALNKNLGQDYRVHVASSYIDGSATAPTVDDVFRLYDDTGKLAAASVGDVIENTRWNAIGIITDVAGNGAWVDFTRLQGGTYPDWVPGETYRVHHNYVDRREYTFNLRINGNVSITNNNGILTRSVCHGYGADCTNLLPSATELAGNGVTELVTVNDFISGDTLIGSARLTVSATGSPQSSFRVGGMNHQLADTDFPAWFVKSRWHQLLYMAYSSELGPTGSGSCSAGGNCLQMLQGNSSLDDRGALIIAAGMQLDDALCDGSPQNRINARLCDYYESENAVTDTILRRGPSTPQFNDRLISILPSTY